MQGGMMGGGMMGMQGGMMGMGGMGMMGGKQMGFSGATGL
jgi:hypothetical protein